MHTEMFPWWLHLTTSISLSESFTWCFSHAQLSFKPHCGSRTLNDRGKTKWIPVVLVKWQHRASVLLMIIFLTRFVGTKQGVLRTYPGLRLQKTYSHRQQSWSVYDYIISELQGKQRRENMCIVCQSRESRLAQLGTFKQAKPSKKTNKQKNTSPAYFFLSVGFALRLNIFSVTTLVLVCPSKLWNQSKTNSRINEYTGK